MQSLDGPDLVRGEPPVLAFREPAQPDRAVGHTVQPLNLESHGLGEAADNPLPAFGA